MKLKNYYRALGVPRDETPSGIRAAYVQLAKRLHPDLAGPESTAAFQEVLEAYEVLSDPVRRTEYNMKLERAEQQERPPAAEPLRAGPAPEPMTRGSWAGGPIVELRLRLGELLRGGVIPVGIPVSEICFACRGSGREWLFPCFQCGGTGAHEGFRTVYARIPAMVARPGAPVEIPVRIGPGRNLLLRVYPVP